MDLNKVYCASDCRNYECKTMLSYSKLKAAEKRKADVKYDDLSANCKEYIKIELKDKGL